MRYFTQAAAVISCAVCLTALSAPAQADIVISGTRIVYKESQKSVNVRLENRERIRCWCKTGWIPVMITLTLVKLAFLSTQRLPYLALIPSAVKQSR